MGMATESTFKGQPCSQLTTITDNKCKSDGRGIINHENKMIELYKSRGFLDANNNVVQHPARRVREDGVFACMKQRKYYISGSAFIKHSLRVKEYMRSKNCDGVLGMGIPSLPTLHLECQAAAVRHAAEKTNIPVPEVPAAFDDDQALHLIMESVPGVSMNKLPAEKKPVVLKQLRRHLNTLHDLQASTPGGPNGTMIEPRTVEKPNKQDEGNIIVDPETLQIRAIVDWEHAGFWPAYFEGTVYNSHDFTGLYRGHESDAVFKMLAFMRKRERNQAPKAVLENEVTE